MKQTFKTCNFRAPALEVIAQANVIINEYLADGYDLTLRQLYYQFVSRGLIANTQQEYSRLGDILSGARLAGMVDWDAIKDRTRNMVENSHWDDPAEIISSAASSFKLDTRLDQPCYIEVWVEKEALAGIVERSSRLLDVPYFACRGYVSQTAMYEAAMRMRAHRNKDIIVIHLGDHDPSGIDMTRDIEDRLNMFQCNITMERIALNMNQVKQYNPPPNPAKLTDSRCRGYIQSYGNSSWELDALDPKVIDQLITNQVNRHTDQEKREALIEEQREHKEKLRTASDNWDVIANFIDNMGDK